MSLDRKNIYCREGYACYKGEEYKLFDSLDKEFLSFISSYDYETVAIPAMIDEDVLKKCGYFESFPDQLSLVGEIKQSNLGDTANGNIPTGDNILFKRKYLTPSACLHIYPMIENKLIYNKAITTLARVYRCEKSGFDELTRLWDFTVREIVFIGSKEYVMDSLQDMKNKAFEMAKKISNEAVIDSANDPFYDTTRNRIKVRIQNKNETKYELRIPINGKMVAVCSFNFHNSHFSKPFNFDNEGKVFSGCVGFGLDRWVAASIENGFNL